MSACVIYKTDTTTTATASANTTTNDTANDTTAITSTTSNTTPSDTIALFESVSLLSGPQPFVGVLPDITELSPHPSIPDSISEQQAIKEQAEDIEMNKTETNSTNIKKPKKKTHSMKELKKTIFV